MLDQASPFLPGTHIQYAWDSTSLGWLKECPRKYFYHMIEGWRSKGENVHLAFGSWVHEGLELYDKQRAEGIAHNEALDAVIQTALVSTWSDGPIVFDHPTKSRETLIRTLIWYLDQFENDPAQTIVLADGKPAVELSFRMELEWGPVEARIGEWRNEFTGKTYETGTAQPYILCGHLDRVVSFQNVTYVMDRKTTSSTPGSYYFDQYEPDNQMTLYTIAAQTVFGVPARGLIIDVIQIAVGFSRPVRGLTYRTPAQIEEWLADLKTWLTQAEGFALANHWPINDKSCHKFGGCPFRKVCSKDPSVRQAFLESDFERHPWNPLEVR